MPTAAGDSPARVPAKAARSAAASATQVTDESERRTARRAPRQDEDAAQALRREQREGREEREQVEDALPRREREEDEARPDEGEQQAQRAPPLRIGVAAQPGSQGAHGERPEQRPRKEGDGQALEVEEQRLLVRGSAEVAPDEVVGHGIAEEALRCDPQRRGEPGERDPAGQEPRPPREEPAEVAEPALPREVRGVAEQRQEERDRTLGEQPEPIARWSARRFHAASPIPRSSRQAIQSATATKQVRSASGRALRAMSTNAGTVTSTAAAPRPGGGAERGAAEAVDDEHGEQRRQRRGQPRRALRDEAARQPAPAASQ